MASPPTTTSTDTVNPGAANPGASSTTTTTATTLVSDHHHHQHHRGGRDYSQSFGEHGRLDKTTTATEATTAIKIDIADRIRFHSTAACCGSQTATATTATTTTTSTDKYLYLIRDILHSPSIHSIRSNSVCSATESVVSSSPNHHCSQGGGDAWSPARRSSLEKEEETTIINMIIPIQQKQQQQQADVRNHRGQPEAACRVPMMAVDQGNADIDNNDEPQPESGAFTNTHHQHHLHLENPAEMDHQKSSTRRRTQQNGNGPLARFYDYLHRISRYVKCSDILVLLALFIFTMILILILRPVPNDLRSILLFILIWLSSFILYRLFPTFKRWFYYWNPGFTLYKPC